MKAREVRKPPVGAIHRLHLPIKPGKCDWCGGEHDERTPVRKQLRVRHAVCDAEIGQICRPELMRAAVFKRDHGICVDCGEDWSDRFIAAKGAEIVQVSGDDNVRAERLAGYWRYTEVRWISLWHADHRVPLWRVVHMPPIERIEYFKLPNVVTRCEPCHKIKSRREAAERAHYARLGKIREDNAEALPSRGANGKIAQRSRWPKGRKIPSRPFRSKGT